MRIRVASLSVLMLFMAGLASSPTFASSLGANRVQAPGLSASVTLTVVADAPVDQQRPMTNYGSAPLLQVDGSPLVRSYLKFNVAGLAGSVTQAILRLYVFSNSNAGVNVYRVADSTWGENTLTYRNAPLLGVRLASTGPLAKGTWVSVNVTPLIRGNGTYSLALAGTDPTAVYFGSRNSSTQPRLIVTTSGTVPPPPAPSAPVPYGQTGKWRLFFSDEFTGSALNLAKWRPNWHGSSDSAITNPVNSSESACFDPRQVTVANGELDLTAVARSYLGHPYASGMIQSDGKFNFTYGYMEARIWTPAGAGMWPAFWTDGQNWPADGEIDILEADGTDSSAYHYHYPGCGGDCGPGGETLVRGATAGWHIYAADWEPGVITWYYDGRKVWQYTTAITSSPQYLVLNLALSSNHSAAPVRMRVDYVRVWKRLP